MRKHIIAVFAATLIISCAGIFTSFAESGWVQREDGMWTYFSPSNGEQASNRWVQTSGEKYWIDPDGTMASNKWIKDYKHNMEGVSGVSAEDEKYVDWYYVGSDGRAAKGWLEIDGKWYFFDQTTNVMLKDAVVDGCQLGSDGAMIN